MIEKRTAPRHRVFKRGTLAFGGGCHMVRNAFVERGSTRLPVGLHDFIW